MRLICITSFVGQSPKSNATHEWNVQFLWSTSWCPFHFIPYATRMNMLRFQKLQQRRQVIHGESFINTFRHFMEGPSKVSYRVWSRVEVYRVWCEFVFCHILAGMWCDLLHHIQYIYVYFYYTGLPSFLVNKYGELVWSDQLFRHFLRCQCLPFVVVARTWISIVSRLGPKKDRKRY